MLRLPSPLEDDGEHHPAQGLGLVDVLGNLDRLLGDPADEGVLELDAAAAKPPGG